MTDKEELTFKKWILFTVIIIDVIVLATFLTLDSIELKEKKGEDYKKKLAVISISGINVVMDLIGAFALLLDNYTIVQGFAILMIFVSMASIGSAIIKSLYWLLFGLNVVITVFGYDLAKIFRRICFPTEIHLVNDTYKEMRP